MPKQFDKFQVLSVFGNILALAVIFSNPNAITMANPVFWAFWISTYLTALAFRKILYSKLKELWEKQLLKWSFILIGAFLFAITIIHFTTKTDNIPISQTNKKDPIVVPKYDSTKLYDTPRSIVRRSTNKRQSQYQNFLDERYVSGIVIPDLLIKNNQNIILDCGAGNEFTCTMDSLKNGTYMENFIGDRGHHNMLNIKLRIVGNKLLVTSTFRDLEHYEVVGKLIDNEWAFVKDKMLDYKCDDKNMEIIDNSDNVIFRLSFIAPNILKYNGYYSGLYSVCVIADDGMYLYDRDDPNYKLKALRALEHLKPVLTHY